MTKSILTVAIAFAVVALSAPARTLTLMSYNIHNGVGLDRQRNHSRLAGIIAAERPDIVGIQEADSATVRAANRFVLGEMGALTSLTPHYAPAIPFDGGKYGIGLLTRDQPLSVTRTPLPGREESRMMIVADYGSYVVINTHLSLTPADAETSVQLIKDAVTRAAGRPVILMGDLNSLPSSETIRQLSELFEIVSPAATPTFPADNPTEQIDYIMISRGTPYTVTRSQVLAPTASRDISLASDHRPLLVTLDLPDSNPR